MQLFSTLLSVTPMIIYCNVCQHSIITDYTIRVFTYQCMVGPFKVVPHKVQEMLVEGDLHT